MAQATTTSSKTGISIAFNMPFLLFANVGCYKGFYAAGYKFALKAGYKRIKFCERAIMKYGFRFMNCPYLMLYPNEN